MANGKIEHLHAAIKASHWTDTPKSKTVLKQPQRQQHEDRPGSLWRDAEALGQGPHQGQAEDPGPGSPLLPVRTWLPHSSHHCSLLGPHLPGVLSPAQGQEDENDGGLTGSHPRGAAGPLLGRSSKCPMLAQKPQAFSATKSLSPEVEVANWNGAEDLEAARTSLGIWLTWFCILCLWRPGWVTLL